MDATRAAPGEVWTPAQVVLVRALQGCMSQAKKARIMTEIKYNNGSCSNLYRILQAVGPRDPPATADTHKRHGDTGRSSGYTSAKAERSWLERKTMEKEQILAALRQRTRRSSQRYVHLCLVHFVRAWSLSSLLSFDESAT